MSIFLAHSRGVNRVGFAALVTVGVGILLSIRAGAQVSEEEHARHHPGQVTASPGASPAQAPGPGMMEGMGEMHGVPPKQLYPTLMSLPTLSAEQRKQVEQQADERIRSGNSLMAQAVDALAQSAASRDYAAMQDATTKLHEGMTQLESGISAKRALAEGRPPPQVALEWFKREMNLPLNAAPASNGFFGNMRFHVAMIAILAAFAAMMIWMYFHKMRRAAHLLQSLTGGAPLAEASQFTDAGTQVIKRSPPPPPTVLESGTSPVVSKWSEKCVRRAIFRRHRT